MTRRLSLLPLAVVVLSMTLFGVTALGHAQTASMTSAQKAAALAGAQALVARMVQARSLSKMAGILTNRSAGAMGVMLSRILGAGIGLGGQMADGQGQSPSGLSQAQIKSNYDALLKRWGIRENDPVVSAGGPHPLPPAVAKNGRGFLADVTALMQKIGPEKDGLPGKSGLLPRDVTYTVLSPTRVKLGMKPGAGRQSMPPAAAILEGGQWRLDLGDFQTMSSHTGG